MNSTTNDMIADSDGRDIGGLYGMIIRRLCSRLKCGALSIVVPSGARFNHRTGIPGPEATLIIHRWRMLRRLILGGDVAFGESFIDGDWSSPDLVALIELAARNDASLVSTTDGSIPARWFNRLMHGVRSNTLAGSRRNIVEHYDLGNDFYRLWLDSGMSYSSALYSDPTLSLEAAQTAKQDRVLALLGAQPGDQILEIGCGWGGITKRLAEQECRVTALTLSPSQGDFAQSLLAANGLSGRAEVLLQDYRETEGSFDRVVSIEMLEAVGESYWPIYFQRLRDRLKPGGVAVLQAIVIADERFAHYRRYPDFVQRYIFPGGMLPSPRIMLDQIERARLRLDRIEMFGDSYARTLHEWHARFVAAWPAISQLGFTQRFRRMWEYYLGYCEAGFRSGAVDVGLWRLTRAP
jgi:cyclopropane-fatty-acyl-phospholipid synthase